MKRTFLISSVAAVAVVGVVAFAAFAHGPNNGSMMGGSMMGMMNGNNPMGECTQTKPEIIDELKSKLALTDNQLPAWETYVNTYKEIQENFTALHESMDPQTMHEMSAEDRQTFMQSAWDSRNEDTKALKTTKDDLFSVLNSEQKTTLNNEKTFPTEPCDNPMQRNMQQGHMVGNGMNSQK